MIDIGMALEGAGGAVTAVGGVYAFIRHISHKRKRAEEKYKEDILDQARSEMKKIEESLEIKIKILEIELESQKLNVSKDFSHFKETHNAEVRVLGEKIENLRQDISQQHQALVGLLTKLVNQ